MYSVYYLRLLEIAALCEFDLVVHGYMGKWDVCVVGMICKSTSQCARVVQLCDEVCQCILKVEHTMVTGKGIKVHTLF